MDKWINLRQAVEKVALRAAAALGGESFAENKPVIAAVNRRATQKQEQNRVFQHSQNVGCR